MHAFSLFFVVLLSPGFVRSDYPPPSEEGHEYYGGENHNGGASSSLSRSAGGLSFVGDWSDKDWQVLSTYNQPKCLEIPSNLTLCRNIGYGQMRLPNLLEHDTLREATQQAASWVRLTHIGCHPDTQVFLCSLFAPVCLDQPIWPCQSLCEAVKNGCEKRMLQYGFPWPDMLRCDRFPSGTDLCIGIRNQQDTEDANEAVCPSCTLASEDSSTVLDSLCQADFVIRAKVEQNLVTGTDLKIITERKKKIFRTATGGSLKAKDLRAGVVFLEGGASCDCPALDTVNGRRSDDHVIIAGNRTGDQRLVASFVQNARRRGILRSVLRELRNKDACTRGGGTSEEKREKKRKKNDGRSRSRSKSQEVGEEQMGEEEEGGKIESKNQKVQNKDKTSGKDRSNNRDNRKKDDSNSDNRKGNMGNRKDNRDNRKGNRNNDKGNKATTPESQTTSTQNPREEAARKKNEKNQRVVAVTSPRPTKRVTTHRRRPV